MARRFALAILASLYLAAPCFAQHPMNWEPCDGGLTQFVPSSVVLTPDPPVIGSPATFTISGTTDAAINGGSIEMVVSFSGLPIYSSSSDLCSKTQCPVPAGPITITLVEALPPIAPPGDYGLQVIARGMDGSELACVNVEFSLVMPGGALGSSSSSRTGSISSSRESGSRKALRAVW